jgi:hypothetical protein
MFTVDKCSVDQSSPPEAQQSNTSSRGSTLQNTALHLERNNETNTVSNNKTRNKCHGYSLGASYYTSWAEMHVQRLLKFKTCVTTV